MRAPVPVPAVTENVLLVSPAENNRLAGEVLAPEAATPESTIETERLVGVGLPSVSVMEPLVPDAASVVGAPETAAGSC